MRIGVDARPLAVLSGIGRYLQQILSRIDTRRHELVLYGDRVIEPPVDVLRQRHSRVRFPASSSLLAQIAYPAWARRDELDVFWSPRHHLPRFRHTATVVTIHDMVWRRAPETMKPLGRALEAALMPAALRHADRIIVVSEATRNDVLDYLPQAAERIRLIPAAPFNVAVADAPRPYADPYILFVGTFEPRKNLNRLLNAYARLAAAGRSPPVLVLAGGIGWKLDVFELVEALKLRDRVRVVVAPGDQELASLYRHAEFLVMPSIYEGFGLPLLEAMACGTPAITSNVSSMPEVAGPGALLVDPMDVDAIADAMDRLLHDDALRAQLADAGRQHAGRFSWDDAAAATVGVLAEAMRERR